VLKRGGLGVKESIVDPFHKRAALIAALTGYNAYAEVSGRSQYQKSKFIKL